jgi:phosphatidylglycerol:prolipoprotein diacylglycerol transferase
MTFFASLQLPMLTHPFIDPVALALGPVSIHWYGIMYLLGFTAFWVLGTRRAQRPDAPLNAQQVGDLLFWGVLGVILGGRLGYIFFYHFDLFLLDPWMILRVWQGGMAFHGGLLGSVLVVFLYARRMGISPLRLGDFIAPLVPIGLGAGRVGNWINGELWGKTTDLPWGMVFPAADLLPRHPSQLYQALLEGVVLFMILWLVSRKPRPAGLITGLFFSLYGSFRFLVEFVRLPDAHLGYLAFDWLTMGQVLSLPLIAIGLWLLGYAWRSGQRSPQHPTPP